MTEEQLTILGATRQADPEPLQPVGLTLNGAATYLGVSRWTIQRLRAAGELEGFHIGAAAMITRASLDAFVRRQRTAEDGPRRG